jgi:hypothetical protein
MNKALLTALLVVAAACSNCGRNSVSPKPKSVPLTPIVETEKVIQTLLTNRELRFVSRAGKLYGMDSDSIVMLATNHYAELIECGYTVRNYTGTYDVNRQGQIILTLTNYRSQWPAMQLCFSGDDFYLQTASGSTRFTMGDRAGATENSRMASFWPFKLVTDPLSTELK